MYNPRKINLGSKFSKCIQKKQSKVILALPTNNSILEIFERTITGGFSCANTRLSFDTKILMPNLKKRDYDNLSIDKSFTAFKKDDVKVIYK